LLDSYNHRCGAPKSYVWQPATLPLTRPRKTAAMINEDTERICHNFAAVIVSMLATYTLTMWAKTGDIEPRHLAAVILTTGVVIYGFVDARRKRTA
jgi:MFS superfamily sulfate permease-like transporter